MYRSMKQSRASWKEELEKGRQLEHMLSYFHTEREAHIAELNEKKTHAEKAVDDYYNRLLSQVEQMKEKTLKLFNTQNRIIQLETRQIMKKCENSSAKLKDFREGLETTDPTQKESVRKDLSALERDVVDLLSKHTHTEYLFTGSADLFEFLEKHEHLGMVSVLDKLSPLMDVASGVECVSWDKSTVIHSSCCKLSEGTLAIGDTRNFVSFECGDVTHKHEVNGEINSLCQVAEEDIIALLHSGERKIHFYNTSPFKHINAIEFQEDICGISKYNNGFMIASPKSDPPCVYLTDRNGTPYSCLGSEPSDGEELFRNPRFTTCKPSGEMVVCDIRLDGIHVFYFKPDGQLDWKRVLSGVTDMSGVAVEAEGNIFVCGTNPHCIFELNLYGFIGRSFPYEDDHTVITFDVDPLKLICRTGGNKFTVISSRYRSVWS